MDDTQAFQQLANEKRAAIGKPAVVWPPSVLHRIIVDSMIGTLIETAQQYELGRWACLQEAGRVADEARQNQGQR